MGLSPTVNGQTGRQNNYTMDGGNNNELYRNIWAVSPPPDAIQEFKVQTNTVDASIYATGANVNVVTKSGGNQIHGDAWEFFRNSALDSTPFFTNFAGAKKGEFQMNQYGFTIGGPLMLPLPGGIYDGRKAKTYFFGYWEGFRSSTASTQFAGVPTSSELGGNFSDLLTSTSAGVDDLGRPLLNGQIFNPYSTRQVTAGAVDSVTGLTATTTGLVRDPFPGNIIPSSLLSTTAPTSLAMIHAFYPSPNFGPGGNSFPNYSISSPDVVKNNQLGVKIDHTFSNNDTLTGSFYLANPSDTGPNALLIGPNVLINHGRNLIVGYTHMISPSTLLTVHYNYVETNVSSSNVPAGLGLLNSLNQQNWMPVKDGIPEVPSIGMSPRMTGTSQWAIPEGPNRSHIFSADLQKVAGKHTFSAGGLLYHMHGYADGWFNLDSFDQRGSGAINTDQSSNFNTGDGLASMLLNLPQQLAGFLGKTSFDGHTLWQGYYVSDKWAVSKSLTLTVGVRYDVVPPSRWLNDQVSGWSASCSCFLISTPFGVNFPFANVRKNYFDPRDNGFQPRFGLAYKITPKLVYRSGFAMFQDHGSELIQEVQNQRIAWPWGVFPNLQGLNAGIPQMQYTFSNPPSAASFLPNPGDPTAIPSGFSGSNNTERTPVTISWNGGIEAQINSSTVFEAQYVGNRSYHMPFSWTYNTPLPSKMGPGPIGPRSPFPTLGEFGYDDFVGYSNYNALQTKLDKHWSSGLSALLSYTWSHGLGIDAGEYRPDTSPPNPYDRRSWYGTSGIDMAQTFSASWVYQLPFGRGQRFGGSMSKAEDILAGGWRASGIVSGHTGDAFTVTLGEDVANTGTGGNQVPNVAGNPVPAGFNQTRDHWFNTNAFVAPSPYTYGNEAHNIMRGPGAINFDFGLMKDFKFTESKYLEFRAEAFNILNHTNFADPDHNMPDSTYGQIWSAANSPRDIQLSLKIVF